LKNKLRTALVSTRRVARKSSWGSRGQ